MGTVIKMFGTLAGGTENAIANIDIPMPGHIVGVSWAASFVLAGTDFNAEVQLSFRSTGSFSTNDDRGIIDDIRDGLDVTTSGAYKRGVNKYLNLPDLPVMGGERIYLHASSTASVTGGVACLVHFDFDLDKVSMRRR